MVQLESHLTAVVDLFGWVETELGVVDGDGFGLEEEQPAWFEDSPCV